VFKLALPTVSDARLNQYLYAEYPTYRAYLEQLDGQKTEQTADSLADLWSINKNEAVAKANELVELGFFESRGTRDEPTFWVPFLYRDALHLIQGRAEADDE
jgi:Fic family protein